MTLFFLGILQSTLIRRCEIVSFLSRHRLEKYCHDVYGAPKGISIHHNGTLRHHLGMIPPHEWIRLLTRTIQLWQIKHACSNFYIYVQNEALSFQTIDKMKTKNDITTLIKSNFITCIISLCWWSRGGHIRSTSKLMGDKKWWVMTEGGGREQITILRGVVFMARIQDKNNHDHGIGSEGW